MKIAIFDEKVIKPLEYFGFKHSFWAIHSETILYTWIAMAILFTLVLVARIYLKKDLNVIAFIFEKSVSFFNDLCQESLGAEFKLEYFGLVSTMFFFTLFCCLVGLIPYVEEATKDLNTTLALGCISFFYVQYQKIKIHGLIAYLKEFTEPFFILLPLNLIGELAKIASMSFRLFGNILGGSIIFLIMIKALAFYKIYFITFSLGGLTAYLILQKIINLEKHKLLNFFLGSILTAVFFVASTQIFFGIFEGIVQSFVITMLTITYLSVAVQKDEVSESE